MGIRQSQLPGIGWRYELDARRGERVATIVQDDGHCGLYMYARGAEEPQGWVELDEDEARRLGGILGDAYLRPEVARGIEDVMGRLVIDWHALEEGSPLAGCSILESRIRSRTGMTVIGISRAERTITNPGPETRLRAGDRVVVVGPIDGMTRFVGLASA